MPIHQTLEQQRAKEAWECAGKAKAKFKDSFKEYVNLVKKAPALISTNGLGQTLAFLAAKAKTKEVKEQGVSRKFINSDTAEGLLYTQLEGWLTKEPQPDNLYRAPYHLAASTENQNQPTRLLYCIACGDSTTYRRATTEALAFITWLKSFADALQEQQKAAGE